jgi:Peptidase M10 serralysin C terminal/Matrixin
MLAISIFSYLSGSSPRTLREQAKGAIVASPTENGVEVSQLFFLSGLNIGPATALVGGPKWGAPWIGEGAELTWSAPQGIGYFDPRYSYYDEPSNWYALSANEIAGAARAMNAWMNVSGLSATRTYDNYSTVGEIRFAKTTRMAWYNDAHAYLPSDDPRGGDVWLNANSWNASGSDANAPGTYAYLTLLHEIGHALGLKHPFEKAYDNSAEIAASYDSHFHTVMSYSAKPYAEAVTADFYPTTPMYLDLVAMRHLYGRDTRTNAGDTKYTFVAGQKYRQTIYDASGKDTILYAGSMDSTIDLRSGRFSTISDIITFSDGTTTRGTVSIGPGVVIERAIGGSGSDTLIGNSANNVLKGGAGSDKLNGGAGNDQLFGSSGNDYLRGSAGKDFFLFNTELSVSDKSNIDRIADFSVKDDTIRLDDAIFHGLKKGLLAASAFCIGPRAKDAKDRIIYDKATGALSYDSDGTGPADSIEFATLPRLLKLTENDFNIF